MNSPIPTTKSGRWQIPAINPSEGFISGLSPAIARELGLDVRWVRMAWVALFLAGGFGGVLYLATWAAIAWLDYQGKTTSTVTPQEKGKNEFQRKLGFILVVAGLFGFFSSVGGLPDSWIWPLGVIALGVAIVWSRVGPNVVDRNEGPYPLIQTIGGVILAAAGAILFVQVVVGKGGNAFLLFAVIGILLVGVLVSSPWWWKILQELDDERQARVRSDERASVAAHIHDSVLQTLTLIQKSGSDPDKMVALARQQERELRNWLDPDRASRSGQSVRGRFDQIIGEIEANYAVKIEAVIVGDALMDPELEEVCAAAREASINAAKHSQTDLVDVYIEVTDKTVEMFIRDRGVGFNETDVASDRQGIANSIKGRMERVGGNANIFSSPGDGTEVELTLPRTPRETSDATETVEQQQRQH